MALALLLLPQQSQQPGQARIEGTVLREGSTEPVSGAKVTVTHVNGATGIATPTAGTLILGILLGGVGFQTSRTRSASGMAGFSEKTL